MAIHGPSGKKRAVKEKYYRTISYFRLLVYADPSALDVVLLVLGFVSAIVSGVPFPLIGILFGQLINDFNAATCSVSSASADSTTEQHDVNSRILIIVYLAIAQFVTMYVHLSCWSLGSARLASRLREKYLMNLMRQDAVFFDQLPAGEVSSRLNGDVQTIRQGTSEKVGICLSSLSFFVTAYIVAFIKNAQLAGMLVSLVPAYFLMSFVGSMYIERYSGRMSDFTASAASVASEALSNVLVVHAFNANSILESRFATDLKNARKEGIKKAFATGVQAGIMYFIAYAANGLAFWQGSRQIANSVSRDGSTTTVGTTFTVIFILIEATLVLSQVAPFIHMFGAASASFSKLREDMEHQPVIDGTSDTGLALHSFTNQIEFNNVSFRYASRPDVGVLENLNLSIPAGRHIALIGASGSGKSTIASLLTRIYDPSGGAILIDGQKLSDVNTRQLRSLISIVQQDPSLLDRSILENIAHGLLNAADARFVELQSVLNGHHLSSVAQAVRNGQSLTQAAASGGPLVEEIVRLVRQAADVADATQFIEAMQYGFATMVGQSGRLLSGGQNQRIALARALIKNPQILVLDEATASLDSQSEHRIQSAISKMAKGRTLITITHRLSIVKTADNIVVLQTGRILEQGTHTNLMDHEGAYARMVRLQGLKPELDNAKPVSSNVSTSADSVTSEIAQINEKDHELNEKAFMVPTSVAEVETQDDEETPPPSNMSIWAVLRGLILLARRYLIVVVVAMLASVVVGGAFSAEAVIFGNTVGSLSPCKSEDSIRSSGRFFGLMFVVLAIIEFFANLISWSAFGWVSEKIVYTVRVLSFRSLFEQDLQWHQSENRNPTILLSYITKDGNALAGLSGSVIGTLFSITVNLIGAVILTHVIAWKIALVCLSVVPLLLGAGLMELRVLSKFEDKHENAYSKSIGISVEAVNSIKTVSALSLEGEIMATYRRSLEGPKKEVTTVSLHASLWLALTYFIGNLVYSLAYWWGSKQIIAGTYSQTQFLIVVFSLLVSAQLWSQMFALAPELSTAKAAVGRILNLINIGSTPFNSKPKTITQGNMEKDLEGTAFTGTHSTSETSGLAITFQDIHFSYPARPEIQVLNGLNLHIQPNQFCAFVGPSGAGKSTILSLLERMYTPSSGSITLDGRDITKSTDLSFRDAIALVPQTSVLFEGSLEFNVALGAKPNHPATRAEVEEACRLANIHDTIVALPDGYDTLCGPNGSRLSGGQKQRLAIARALVRKPRLLILDESTSALDADSERLLQDGLDTAAKGITVVAIAHRLNTIRRADVIFLIEGGRCVDRGTHEELIGRSESYRANVLHQTIEADDK